MGKEIVDYFITGMTIALPLIIIVVAWLLVQVFGKKNKK